MGMDKIKLLPWTENYESWARDHATIAAQAARIVWLERPIGNDELKASLREVYQEDSEHNGIFDGMMKFALESALKIRIGDGT